MLKDYVVMMKVINVHKNSSHPLMAEKCSVCFTVYCNMFRLFFFEKACASNVKYVKVIATLKLSTPCVSL